jgi:hypothetical protein
MQRETIVRALIDPKIYAAGVEQLTLFADEGEHALPGNKFVASVTAATEEAVSYLAKNL